MNRHELLRRLHEHLAPRTYLETGVNLGRSMALSRVPSIGIDPEFSVTSELQADVHLARTSSDEFFARRRPLAHLPIPVVDLAFIDGMHLSEYALRDLVVAVERFHPADQRAGRRRHAAGHRRDGQPHADDVALDRRRLQGQRRPARAAPRPGRRRGGHRADRDLSRPPARRDTTRGSWRATTPGSPSGRWCPTPQTVPDEVLRRTRAIAPEELLSAIDWSALRAARQSAARPGEPGPARAAIQALIRRNAVLVG